MSEIKVEFAVQMRGELCAEKVRNALKDAGKVHIDATEGRVTVETKEPWCILKEKIECTGRKAVLVGFGGQSAVAIINATGSDVDRTPIQGILRFSALTKDHPGVVVDGVVDGLTPGLHGLHVHEAGDISSGCESLGEHYNPRGSPHGGPDDTPDARHAGDLGNIRADDRGRATFRFVDPVLAVWDIIGRSVAITANADDLGRGGNSQSRIDGNAGARIACGIIARSAGILENFKKICACDGVTLWDERNKPIAGGDRAQKL
ncbi:PREDICTED: copper chaperone for superoxide dismutase-like [Rhagoletis zephyria]|uniref:copper chaperone for superoxide dismutase-like n=1 Tax=Rhagoletis zephyria TaxID=28612 RepID=UPI0008114617|nr:PREDICTED: copper chaperone for superoxide dismutase-like [Rhagoletis zephyria]